MLSSLSYPFLSATFYLSSLRSESIMSGDSNCSDLDGVDVLSKVNLISKMSWPSACFISVQASMVRVVPGFEIVMACLSTLEST